MVREELREGSGLFSILAFLPAQASFGLADDLRARTSGGASAALMLSHWERLQAPPCAWHTHSTTQSTPCLSGWSEAGHARPCMGTHEVVRLSCGQILEPAS